MSEESPNDLIKPPELEPAELELAGRFGAEPDFAPVIAPPPQAAFQPDMFGIPAPVPEVRPRRIPHLGHVLLFFVMALVLLGIGQLLAVLLLQLTHIFPHRSFDSLFIFSSTDARASIPIQAMCYGLITLVCIPVFSVLWHEPFAEGVHWDNGKARSRFFWLVILGLGAGFSIAYLGSFLPMPKNPPIMQDMMKSSIGAWMMLVFGLTVAPLFEELAFRGFLLPGLLNFFRWVADRGAISQNASLWIGVPVSILLTSLGFAFMHSPQVSHAWGPLVLIGSISVVLCIVRLAMNSVAAAVVVHAAYNFTLFAGVLYQTGGFRHLEKLTS